MNETDYQALVDQFAAITHKIIEIETELIECENKNQRMILVELAADAHYDSAKVQGMMKAMLFAEPKKKGFFDRFKK